MTDLEQQLRAMMQAATADLMPSVTLYERIRRQHRRRQRRVVSLVAVMVAGLLGGVPLAARAHLELRHGDPVAAAPRGSLADDVEVRSDAVAYARANIFSGANTVDKSTIRMPYAERTAGYTVALVVGQRSADNWRTAAYVGRASGEQGWQTVGVISGQPQPDTDPAAGTEYGAPMQVLTSVSFAARGRNQASSFAVLIFPPGHTATMRAGSGVSSDCRRTGARTENVPLTDGTALVPIAIGDNPSVTVQDESGATVLSRPLGRSPYNPPDLVPLAGPVSTTGWAPTGNQYGEIGSAAAEVAEDSGAYEVPRRYLAIWAAWSGTELVYLAGAEYTSGAIVLVGRGTDANSGRSFQWVDGCAPAGRLAGLVVTGQLGRVQGAPVAVVVRGAARVQVDCTGARSSSQPLAGVAGVLVATDHGCILRRALAFSVSGGLIGQARPGEGLVALPLTANG